MKIFNIKKTKRVNKRDVLYDFSFLLDILNTTPPSKRAENLWLQFTKRRTVVKLVIAPSEENIKIFAQKYFQRA